MLTTAQLGKAFLAEDMERAIRSILDVHGVLDAFDAAKNFYIKIESSGFMPLTIEKHGRQIVVAHYYEQNGDLVPDPDMSFIKTDLGWIPMAIQHSSGSYYIAS